MRSVRVLGTALLAPALVGAVAAGALLGLLGPTAPATASSASSASARAGTTPCVGVIVDGRLAGGTLHTACAKGDPRSGLAALTDAGISYAFVPRQPGQVCQLDGLPECSRTSADTYWSYWWRAEGSQHWVYATEGAASHDPEPGDTEGWVWQDGGRRQPPSIAFSTVCPQAAAPRPTPSPIHSAPTPTRSSARPSPEIPATPSRLPKTAPSSLSTDDSATSATPAPPATSAATTASPSPSGPAAPSTSTDAASPSPSAAAGGGDTGSSPPWAGLAVGAGAVALLGGAAVTRFRRTPGSS